jgi:hypothetical protein
MYKRLVEAKGEPAASAILTAVQHVTKGDSAKQAELLWKAVTA